MNSQQSSPLKFRRSGIAFVVGAMALLLIFVLSVIAEPYLIAFADGAPYADPRSSARAWADSNLWLAATSACCLSVFSVGYVATRISPAHSHFAATALFVLVVLYVFLAQFPATASLTRIALWSIALPASFALGAWLPSRARNAA